MAADGAKARQATQRGTKGAVPVATHQQQVNLRTVTHNGSQGEA